MINSGKSQWVLVGETTNDCFHPGVPNSCGFASIASLYEKRILKACCKSVLIIKLLNKHFMSSKIFLYKHSFHRTF